MMADEWQKPETLEALAACIKVIRDALPDALLIPVQACRRCGYNLWDGRWHDEEWNCLDAAEEVQR